MMKLPTVKGRTSYHPKKALCPWCQQNKVLEPHSFAVLSGGALLMDREEDYGSADDNMDGYLELLWHGAHDGGEGKNREIGARVQIAHDVRGGQFEVYFCSTECLRSYLNYCVDVLEKKMKNEKAGPKK